MSYGKGWPDEDAWETFPKIERNLNLVSKPTGFESWLIVKKKNTAIIGDVGFKGQPGLDGKVDIGYAIIFAERYQGFATEAVKELMSWRLISLVLRTATARCFRSNLGSKSLLQKIGFLQEKEDAEMIYWSLENRSYNFI